MSHLKLWCSYYMRWHPSMLLQEPVARRDRALIEVMRRFRELTTSAAQTNATQKQATATSTSATASTMATTTRSVAPTGEATGQYFL
ncbi:unnamed protein product [Protopolystoma xenopodis]|uniref:Myotubularin phosphatase domain-containing protein n=1 Tax=Protopolystoma xenopodis TaxID=117903 RepID=A0A3S5ADD6_9PLAT|nr:unnamed protein product [Protopolystoma xenopodis]